LKLTFTKMQGAGNDFIVLEANSAVADWGRLAVEICDRHYGVGADGLLVVCPSKTADLRMRIFNADGSEANICGNGLRCLVKYHVERRRVRVDHGVVAVETLAGVREAWFSETDGKVGRVRVGMGVPSFGYPDVGDPATYARRFDITLTEPCGVLPGGTLLEFDLVSLGNSHAVLFTDGPVSTYPLHEVGAVAGRYPRVFGAVNLEVAHVVNAGHIEARVLEHGVGETLACGSGACAISAAAHARGYTVGEVQVFLPGGVLAVEYDGISEVFMTGPAETVFCGEWPSDDVGSLASHSPIKNEVLA
jgi:diaminopimelate epimerase